VTVTTFRSEEIFLTRIDFFKLDPAAGSVIVTPPPLVSTRTISPATAVYGPTFVAVTFQVPPSICGVGTTGTTGIAAIIALVTDADAALIAGLPPGGNGAIRNELNPGRLDCLRVSGEYCIGNGNVVRRYGDT
jgi:hypothetical protein